MLFPHTAVCGRRAAASGRGAGVSAAAAAGSRAAVPASCSGAGAPAAGGRGSGRGGAAAPTKVGSGTKMLENMRKKGQPITPKLQEMADWLDSLEAGADAGGGEVYCRLSTARSSRIFSMSTQFLGCTSCRGHLCQFWLHTLR